ncbi:helix-turn-helix domain-containing protein [Tamlana sp. I1]|uniref:helix-turn-helix domain-containing protein n=1 Tax=Tamlana sp. I1 TaxID=2762061 RepID=UPI00188F66CE|nr:helix-turn-helix transcriptional regulator [Tamlana sp. I1]
MLRIKQILKDQGKTQKDLAKDLDMTPIGVNKLIKGNPTLETLHKIAKALGVEVIDLFEKKTSDTAKVIYIKEDGKFKPVGCLDKLQ